MRLLALLGGGIAAALGCAVGAAYGVGSPLAGGVEGTDTWSIVFLSAAAIAFVLYVTALLALRSHANALRRALALTVLIQLVPLTGPLLLSRDAYSYWAYGRIVWVHNDNPYDHAPARYPDDPATVAAAPAWRHTTSVYGAPLPPWPSRRRHYSRRESQRGRRWRPRSSAGIRSSLCTSPAAVTTTPSWSSGWWPPSRWHGLRRRRRLPGVRRRVAGGPKRTSFKPPRAASGAARHLLNPLFQFLTGCSKHK